ALHTAGGVMLGVTYGPAIGRRGDGPGFAAVHVRLPSDPALMGATLYTQWSVLELLLPPHQWSNALGISLSNGVRATLSAGPNTLGLATITSESFANTGPVPTRGFVNC